MIDRKTTKAAKVKVPLSLQLKISLKGLGYVFANPVYTGLAVLVAFMSLGVVVWWQNWRLLFDFVSMSSISVSNKFRFFFDGYGGIFTNFEGLTTWPVIVISVLMGATIALLVSVGVARASAARGGGAVLAAVFGVGCAACGTSILAPVLASVGVGTSLTFLQSLGLLANFIAILLLTYSIFRLGLEVSRLRANNPH